MRISKTEIRLRRLLAAVPHQTNKQKLVHHLATLRKLLNNLKDEAVEPSLSESSDSKLEYYSRCIGELSQNVKVTSELDDTGMEDICDSTLFEEAPNTSSRSGEVQFSDERKLSRGASSSEAPLFPSCLKRKYSPDPGVLAELESTELGFRNSEETENDKLGKRICVGEDQTRASVQPAHLDAEEERVGKMEEEHTRENGSPERVYGRNPFDSDEEGEGVAETSSGSDFLADGLGITDKCDSGEEREDEAECLDDEARLYIREQRNEQEKMVEEMLILTNQIKEGSRLLGSSLHQTAALLSSSEHSLKHCLSATASAQMKTGELLTQTQERESGCATWFSLLLMRLGVTYPEFLALSAPDAQRRSCCTIKIKLGMWRNVLPVS
ncbi:hypothetical protein R1sor_000171 [Riccia sorocarpa]|uniref:Uncharacterized protein n=1 Tax=Riccia sorocarpa TaxID=122646 RepID=A0ABD3GWC2_9MARC